MPYVESGSKQGLGLLTTLVVATCRCRKISSDITAFEMSSDIFKNVDKNVDVKNVEIFKRDKLALSIEVIGWKKPITNY